MPPVDTARHTRPSMRRLWLLFAQAVTVALAVVLVLAAWQPAWWASMRWGGGHAPPGIAADSGGIAGPPIPAALSTLPVRGPASTSFATAVRRAAPAVVTITANKINARKGGQDAWQRYFFGDPRNQAQTGLGSGVLVSAEG